MPPPRKIDLLPSEVQNWLKDELKERGFSGYVELADDLNAMLAERGLEVSIGKSAVHEWGVEQKAFVELQEEAAGWTENFMTTNGLQDEANRHNVLFQMLTTLAFKVMRNQMTKDADEINPQELNFLSKLMKDVMSSSAIREKLGAEERKRIAEEAAAAQVAEMRSKLDVAEGEGGTMALAAQQAREILGFE